MDGISRTCNLQMIVGRSVNSTSKTGANCACACCRVFERKQSSSQSFGRRTRRSLQVLGFQQGSEGKAATLTIKRGTDAMQLQRRLIGCLEGLLVVSSRRGESTGRESNPIQPDSSRRLCLSGLSSVDCAKQLFPKLLNSKSLQNQKQQTEAFRNSKARSVKDKDDRQGRRCSCCCRLIDRLGFLRRFRDHGVTLNNSVAAGNLAQNRLS